VVICP